MPGTTPQLMCSTKLLSETMTTPKEEETTNINNNNNSNTICINNNSSQLNRTGSQVSNLSSIYLQQQGDSNNIVHGNNNIATTTQQQTHLTNGTASSSLQKHPTNFFPSITTSSQQQGTPNNRRPSSGGNMPTMMRSNNNNNLNLNLLLEQQKDTVISNFSDRLVNINFDDTNNYSIETQKNNSEVDGTNGNSNNTPAKVMPPLSQLQHIALNTRDIRKKFHIAEEQLVSSTHAGQTVHLARHLKSDELVVLLLLVLGRTSCKYLIKVL